MDLRNKLSSLSVSPRKILKIVIGLSVVMLLMWLFTLSQIDYTEDTGGREVFQKEQQADSLSTAADDSTKSEAAEVNRYGESSNMFSNGLVTFFVLIIILGLIWFWIDRSERSDSPKKGRELGSYALGEGVQLKIIRINNEIWILGVASSSVDLLHRYTEEEWKESEAEPQKADRDSFAKLFRSKI